MNLEDLEGKEGICNDVEDEKGHKAEEKEGSQVFLNLVETMKASGNLPEKPTPTVSGNKIYLYWVALIFLLGLLLRRENYISFAVDVIVILTH